MTASDPIKRYCVHLHVSDVDALREIARADTTISLNEIIRNIIRKGTAAIRAEAETAPRPRIELSDEDLTAICLATPQDAIASKSIQCADKAGTI